MVSKERCLICNMETSNVFEETDLPICDVCKGKYGNKLKQKIESLDLEEYYEQQLNKEIKEDAKPFEAKVSYSGGTKNDVIDMILGIMDSTNVTIEDLKSREW